MFLDFFKKLFGWSKPQKQATQPVCKDTEMLLTVFDVGNFKAVFFYLKKLNKLPQDLANIIPQFNLYFTIDVVKSLTEAAKIATRNFHNPKQELQQKEGQADFDYTPPNYYKLLLANYNDYVKGVTISIPSFVKIFIIDNRDVKKGNILQPSVECTKKILISKKNQNTTILFLQDMTLQCCENDFVNFCLPADVFIVFLDLSEVMYFYEKCTSEKLKNLPLSSRFIFGTEIIASERVKKLLFDMNFLGYDVELQIHKSREEFYNHNIKEFSTNPQ
jgi:hypothetical protein